MALTLSGPAQHQDEIRKSRFLALAALIDSPQQARAFIEQQREPAASHNCWAWRCGQQYRFSDDGEPGGTAGRPILAAIDALPGDCLVVLVIRWYGGIPLGTGGLARAYGGCAARALQAGPLLERVERLSLCGHVPFAELARVKARFADWQAVLEQEHFDEQGAHLHLAIPAEQLQRVQQQLADIGRGQLWLRPAGC
ncbi:TPA: YigZ family protein [Klebsiella pneumoniae]